jgi:hypothetical protein
MKLISILLSYYLSIAFQSYSTDGVESKGTFWLNIDYIVCLESKLPCECEKLTETYYSLVLDTNSNCKSCGITLAKYQQMEPYFYQIKKKPLNEYEILNKDNNRWAKLLIKGDTLSFIENNVLSKFKRMRELKDFDKKQYIEYNVSLLDKAFTLRGYPTLEEIIGQKSLICECNKWMGNTNILYIKGEPKSWVLEIVNDSLQISKIVNIESDPDDPLKTEKIKSYKW